MRLASSIALVFALMLCVALPASAQYGPGGGGQRAAGAGGDGSGSSAGADPGMLEGGLGDMVPPIGQTPSDQIMDAATHDQFADLVDVEPLRKLAVFHGGRAKILDTLARETIQQIHGRSSYKRPHGDPQYLIEGGEIRVERDYHRRERKYDPVFTFMDLVLNGDYYMNRPLLHVPHVEVRRAVLTPMEGDERERLMRIGRVPPRLPWHPESMQALEPFQQQVVRQQQLNRVLGAAMNFIQAGSTLNLVSPVPGDPDERWPHLTELAGESAPQGQTRRGEGALIEMVDYSGLGNAELNGQIVETFRSLATAWRRGDAAEANVHIEQLAALLPQVHPETYPPYWKRNLEHWYNWTNKFTYSYLAYFTAFVALLLAFATGWGKALLIGGVLLGIGFIGHTSGLLARIVLSDRPWTIHNQFESFFVLTWFAALAGLVLLMIYRQWIFGAAAAAISAVMLMVANNAPIPSSEIGPQPAVLATSNILYVHVNIMIVAYALISLALILSVFYLFTYYSSIRSAVKLAQAGLQPTSISQVATSGAEEGGGGAASSTGEEQPAQPAVRSRAALLNDLDGAQMVVIQLVFWLTAVGILLGAYWADHAWGRWWAWDPKETWSLILWIVYLIAIHVRLAVKKRGLVTAWLSVLGFVTMLWTHWGVNLLLSGLHSYA